MVCVHYQEAANDRNHPDSSPAFANERILLSYTWMSTTVSRSTEALGTQDEAEGRSRRGDFKKGRQWPIFSVFILWQLCNTTLVVIRQQRK